MPIENVIDLNDWKNNLMFMRNAFASCLDIQPEMDEYLSKEDLISICKVDSSNRYYAHHSNEDSAEGLWTLQAIHSYCEEHFCLGELPKFEDMKKAYKLGDRYVLVYRERIKTCKHLHCAGMVQIWEKHPAPSEWGEIASCPNHKWEKKYRTIVARCTVSPYTQ